MRPCVELLKDLLESAENGTLRDIFVVQRKSDGTHEASYVAKDIGAMLVQVRAEVIRLRCRRP